MNVVASPATWGVAGLGLAAALFRLPQFYLVPRVFAHTSSAQWLDGGTIPENVPGTWRTALVVGVLWGFDWAVGRGLARAGLGLQRLPSSIASMLLSVGALGAVQLVAGASTADKVCALFQPAVGFLGRYFLSFLTVVVVPLPSAVGQLWQQGGLSAVLKVLLIHLAGWCFTHSSTAVVARTLGGSTPVRRRAAVPVEARPVVSSADQTQELEEPWLEPTAEDRRRGKSLVGQRVKIEGMGKGTVVGFNKRYGPGASTHAIQFDSAPNAPPEQVKLARKTNTDPEKMPWLVSPADAVRLQRRDLIRGSAVDKNPNEYLPFTDPIQQAVVKHRDAVRSVWTTATCVSYAAVPFIGPAPALVCTLQSSLLHAERLPSWVGPAAPLLVSAATTAVACIVLGRARGEGLQAALAKYMTTKKHAPLSGAGNFHFELISAATVALGFRVFALRRLVLSRLAAIAGSVTVASTTSLFLTPLVGRLCGLAPALSLMLSQRSVTTPFALAGAEALGADPTLTAAILSVGAIHCALLGVKLLDALGMRADSNPLARGLAMGCSSYGVGTGTLLQQGEDEAAAVSSTALVLMGVVHSLLCSAPPVLLLLQRIAAK